MNNYKLIKFSKRLEDSLTIRKKYSQMFPIIFLNNNNNLKLLVSKNIGYDELIFMIRKKLKLEKNIELLINNKPIIYSNNINYLYANYKHNDGMLYITCNEIPETYTYLHKFKNLIKHYIF